MGCDAQAWAGALDLNAAVRYTDYSTSGEVTTWKTGVTYSPVNEVTLRATRSRDIRAPNILELFQSPTQGTSQIVDPRTGLTDTFQGLTGGNTALEAEIADTIAAGIVYRPAWLDGFATSLDYYRIEIDDAIATLTAQTRQQPLAVSVAVDIRGVEEIDPKIERTMQAAHRFRIVDLTPGSTDRPGAKADAGNFVAGSAE